MQRDEIDAKLEQFAEKNPTSVFTAQELSTKWGAERKQLSARLRALSNKGRLRRIKMGRYAHKDYDEHAEVKKRILETLDEQPDDVWRHSELMAHLKQPFHQDVLSELAQAGLAQEIAFETVAHIDYRRPAEKLTKSVVALLDDNDKRTWSAEEDAL